MRSAIALVLVAALLWSTPAAAEPTRADHVDVAPAPGDEAAEAGLVGPIIVGSVLVFLVWYFCLRDTTPRVTPLPPFQYVVFCSRRGWDGTRRDEICVLWAGGFLFACLFV